MSKELLPMALIMWIKRDQEERAIHAEKLVWKNQQEDKEYMRYISFLIPLWSTLKMKEKELLLAFVSWNESGRNFSTNQRSAISSLYLKHYLSKSA